MSVMRTMNEEDKARYKAQKLANIREYHSDLINDLGIDEKDFNMKSKFKDQHSVDVVGIFPSEFKKKIGFFFELIDSDLNPTDPNRTVYRLAPNEAFADEFEANPKGYYSVPLDELRIVNKNSVAITGAAAVTASDNVFKVTAKAQETAVPVERMVDDNQQSQNLIEDTYHKKFMMFALQGLCAHKGYDSGHAGTAYQLASECMDIIKRNKKI